MSVLASVAMQAQEESNDYIPFVELGKQLHLVIVSDPKYAYSTGRYWMCREMERDGKTYVFTYLPYDVMMIVEEVGLLREENRRVYKYDETTGRDIMLYDFSLKEGDTFTYEYGFDQPVKCKVLKQGWLEDGPVIVSSRTQTAASDVKHRWLRTWTIGRDNGSGGYDEVTTWVEGVGTLENMFSPLASGRVRYCLSYVERNDIQLENDYLPFSLGNLSDKYCQIHGCNLPTGEDNWEGGEQHQLTYELDGDRLHVYGDVFTQCGPNNYAFFFVEATDDPLVYKIEFFIQEVEPLMDCMALHATDFYVPGFDPNLNYIVVDNQGAEHPVVNKAEQIAYRPFIEEGKVWKVGDIWYGDPVKLVEYYYFDGDTIIDGRTCKQMMCQRYVSPDYPYYDAISHEPSLWYVGAWREEDKKVYFYDASLKHTRMVPELMYDFSTDANDTLWIGTYNYVRGPRQTGGTKGFKGAYRDVWECENGEIVYRCAPWLEGVGSIYGPPTTNVFNVELEDPACFLMSCTVGDEVIYLNDKYEDGATPGVMEANKRRIDFTHTVKTRPKAPKQGAAGVQLLYGEYSSLQLDIDLYPLDDTWQVCIADETGRTVYEKTVDAASIVGLNIDISDYTNGRYTVTVENDSDSFTGEFTMLATGISDMERLADGSDALNKKIYNLQGQRVSRLQRGLNIVDGQKVFMK